MSIVTPQRLNRFLSSPTWSDDQWAEVADLCEEVEQTLADRLMTMITPVPYRERVSILQSGLVATRHPVASVNALNGVPVTGDLPTPWRLQEGRLRWSDVSLPPFTPSSFSLITGWDPIGSAARVCGIGEVDVDYQAGWGDHPTLRLLILRKIETIFMDRHDDSVVVHNVDANQTISRRPPNEDWTDAELASVGAFRNLAAWK